MSKVAAALKTLAFAGIFGILSAQAVPVVFTGQIDIDPTGGNYFIEFGVSDKGSSEPTFYSLFWDAFNQELSDSSFNFDSVTATGGAGWNFVFTHEVLSETFDLDFSQAIEKFDAAVSFALATPDRTVLITPDPFTPTRVNISGLNPNSSYLANIAATDPFVGTLAINAMAGGAPELDPRSSSVPALFMFGALLATRRRRQSLVPSR